MTDADYADDLMLLANAPAQAESGLLAPGYAAGGTGLYTNTNKFLCFKQEGTISILNGKPLKLVDKFTYLGSNTSFTESNVNIFNGKA